MTINKTDDLGKAGHKNHAWRSWLIVLFLILAAVVIRGRILEVPLERDEGGYAYTAQLILQGIPPLVRAYDIKLPGVHYIYALILLIFGQTTAGIHMGLLIINVATIVMMFLLGRRLFDTAAGLMAGASYAIMSVSQHVLGFSANVEHLLILPALGGILLLLYAIDSRRLTSYFGSGLLLGLTLVIKQHGIFFVVFAAIYLLISYFSKPKGFGVRCILEYAAFGFGIIIPFSVFCLYYLQLGLFDEICYWMFEYPSVYTSAFPLSTGLRILKNQLLEMGRVWLPLVILSGVGLISLFFQKQAIKRIIFVGAFLLFSLLSVIPGYRFFPHYFVFALPAISLLSGIGISFIAKLLAKQRLVIIRNGIPILLSAGAILYSVLAEKTYLFESSPDAISKTSYSAHPFFPESVEIGNYINRNTSPEDYISVIGDEPQIYFYARRRSASAQIFFHHLTAIHRRAKEIQQESIREIEHARPKYIVFVNSPLSLMVSQESEKMIFTWFEEYQQKYYRLVGMVDILSLEDTVYRWDEEVVGYEPQGYYWLAVFRRNNESILL
jgi:hypothetical protein